MSHEDELQRLRRKANQEWELAGCARKDGDSADELKHTEKARDYDRQIKELCE